MSPKQRKIIAFITSVLPIKFDENTMDAYEFIGEHKAIAERAYRRPLYLPADDTITRPEDWGVPNH